MRTAYRIIAALFSLVLLRSNANEDCYADDHSCILKGEMGSSVMQARKHTVTYDDEEKHFPLATSQAPHVHRGYIHEVATSLLGYFSTLQRTLPDLIGNNGQARLPAAPTLRLVGVMVTVLSTILVTLSVAFKSKQPSPMRRAPSKNLDFNDTEIDGVTHFAMSGDDFIDHMGLGGLVLQDMSCMTASGISLRKQVIVLAIQSWVLQFGMLYFLLTGLQPFRYVDGAGKDLPVFMIFIAIYLHLIASIRTLPIALSIFSRLNELQSGWDYYVSVFVFIIDQFVLMASTIVVGALYLCTSKGVSALILNSCAIAFVGNIDDWIMSINMKVRKVAGIGQDEAENERFLDVDFMVPTNSKLSMILDYMLTWVPVVPITVSAGLVYVGLMVLRL